MEKKNCCAECGTEREKIVCLRHQYFVGMHNYLKVIHGNIWNAEVNELSLGKADNLRYIMNQLSEVIQSLDKVVKDPEYYSIEKLLRRNR